MNLERLTFKKIFRNLSKQELRIIWWGGWVGHRHNRITIILDENKKQFLVTIFDRLDKPMEHRWKAKDWKSVKEQFKNSNLSDFDEIVERWLLMEAI